MTRWPAKHKWAKLHYSRLWYTITQLYITYVASVNSTPKFGKVIWCAFHFIEPRIYPVPFARVFADMLEDLKRTSKGQPQLPNQVPSALSSFQELKCADTSVWRHVHLAPVFNYLRRNKKLRIPVEWQAFVPTHMHEVSEGWSVGKIFLDPKQIIENIEKSQIPIFESCFIYTWSHFVGYFGKK